MLKIKYIILKVIILINISVRDKIYNTKVIILINISVGGLVETQLTNQFALKNHSNKKKAICIILYNFLILLLDLDINT